jgi:hypothetical protein
MSVSPRVIPLLKKAYGALQDAQAHVDATDRATLGRDLDDIRWKLGDFLMSLEMDDRLDTIR